MRDPWDHLCSPRHVMVFEAAARQGSFTRAAAELNVQQPAISATIRQLEERLGVPLFARSHRKVTLTSAGERLFSDVSGAFDQLSHSARTIQQRARHDYVTLNASTAFNNYWMLPRLAQLQRAHPEIDLRLQSSDREPDLHIENISLAIRRGNGHWPDYESALIAPEVIYPVAAPQVMASAVNLTTIPNLLHQRLIHLEEPIRERPSWRDWFRNFGIRADMPRSGLRLNEYALVLQATMAGEGFAFGWGHLADRLVDQGLLAAKRDWSWTTGKAFYLVWPARTALSDDARRVRDWMLAERGP